jgi:hypothetical protein
VLARNIASEQQTLADAKRLMEQVAAAAPTSAA